MPWLGNATDEQGYRTWRSRFEASAYIPERFLNGALTPFRGELQSPPPSRPPPLHSLGAEGDLPEGLPGTKDPHLADGERGGEMREK